VHSVGPAFGPRPQPTWLSPAVKAADGAQADGARSGVRTTVTAHLPLTPARPTRAHRWCFLNVVFTVRMRMILGWRRATFQGWGLTRSVRRRRGGPGRRSRLAMRGSDGRQLAALFPAASHEKGERLGTANGGEGWSVVVIIENGAAAEQGTGDGEKLKYG
jgi:hypothetical protein